MLLNERIRFFWEQIISLNLRISPISAAILGIVSWFFLRVRTNNSILPLNSDQKLHHFVTKDKYPKYSDTLITTFTWNVIKPTGLRVDKLQSLVTKYFFL